MREILFRGKRKDNKEWVFGFYIFEPVFNGIDHKPTEPKHWIREYNQGQICIIMHEVIPETLGEYTGLKDVGLYLEGKFDKNGMTIGRKDIYELDILEVIALNVFADGYPSLGGGQRSLGEKFVVVKLVSGFTLIPIKSYAHGDNNDPNRHGFVNNYNFWNAHSTSLKKIGNIHKNPELLKAVK